MIDLSTTSAPASPVLSIVVACVNTRRTLQRWLDAVAPQVDRGDVEVLVAAAADDRGIESVSAAVSFVPVTGREDALTPELWGQAMSLARGRVIAVTISACVPAADWVDRIIAAHVVSRAGVGGVIEIAPGASVVDRAIHLVRYTAYLPPVREGIVKEIAGDNGVYQRDALASLMPEIRRDGFWETDAHRVLHDRGLELWLDPSVCVSFAGSHSIPVFSRQRYRHGRVFGRSRAASQPAVVRIVRAAAAPLVPWLMLARSVRLLAAKRRLDARALSAVPLALWFLMCWAAGEAVGLLQGEAGRNRLG